MSPVLSPSPPPLTPSPVDTVKLMGYCLSPVPRMPSTSSIQTGSTTRARVAVERSLRPSRSPGVSNSTTIDCVGGKLAKCALTTRPAWKPSAHDVSVMSKNTAVLSAATQVLCTQHKDFEILSGISYSNFIALSRFLEDNSARFRRKPKLTYFVDDEMVFIQWPSRVHEVPIEEFSLLFKDHQTASISQQVRVSAHTNNKIITKFIHGIPDLSISITSMKAKLQKHLLIFECAFSQPSDKLFRKVRKLVAGLPDIRMVFILLVHEETAFHAPYRTSAAWEKFENNPSLLTLFEFLDLYEEEETQEQRDSRLEEFMGPVTAGGHVWCNISRVRYYVWLRCESGKIEINPGSIKQTEWSAYGELPVLGDGSDMRHVTKVVNRGLAAVRGAIMETHRTAYERIQIPVDSSLFAMPITLPPSWNYFRSSLTEAKSQCAYERYQVWYLESFRTKGEKHTLSDSDYIPSEEESVSEHLPRRPPSKRIARDDNAVGRAESADIPLTEN